MGVSTAALQTGTHLVLALVVLFGGIVSAGMLGLLLGTGYFLPGPPPRWSLRAGAGASVLGAALSSGGITVAVVTRGAGGDAAW